MAGRSKLIHTGLEETSWPDPRGRLREENRRTPSILPRLPGSRRDVFTWQDTFQVSRVLGGDSGYLPGPLNVQRPESCPGISLRGKKGTAGAARGCSSGPIARSASDWSRLPGRRGAGPEARRGRNRKRALSNWPLRRRRTQATSGAAMAANATTNPSQLLPLGNRGPVGRGVGS